MTENTPKTPIFDQLCQEMGVTPRYKVKLALRASPPGAGTTKMLVSTVKGNYYTSMYMYNAVPAHFTEVFDGFSY